MTALTHSRNGFSIELICFDFRESPFHLIFIIIGQLKFMTAICTFHIAAHRDGFTAATNVNHFYKCEPFRHSERRISCLTWTKGTQATSAVIHMRTPSERANAKIMSFYTSLGSLFLMYKAVKIYIEYKLMEKLLTQESTLHNICNIL